MKWAITQPREGDTREVRRFAWWPVQMSDSGIVVWLAFYVETRVYESHVCVDLTGAPYSESGWVRVSRECR